MAALQAMGCSRAAAAAALTAHANCVSREAMLSLGLPIQRRKWGLHSFFPVCRAGNVVRRSSVLNVRAKIKLVDTEMGPTNQVKEVEKQGDSSGFYEKVLISAIAFIPLVDVEAASAAGGEWGFLEGRSLALIHPFVMSGLFLFTLYAGYLGWQWRRVRTIQNEITALKKQVEQVPVAAGDKSAPPSAPSPIEAQINSLTEQRKELVKGGFRDRHYNAGSILLGLGVFEAVGGAFNTWSRSGKLYPGPHLFGGAGIVICWALAASLVPAMQKGNETARNLHIALNLLNVGLFISQLPTGWEIVQKVFEFTKWP
ncbi:unnamed protein product [Calypogeia fissa]